MKNIISNRDKKELNNRSWKESDSLPAKDMENSLKLIQRAGKMGVWDYNFETDKVYLSDQLLELFRIKERPHFGLTLDQSLQYILPECRKSDLSDFLQSLKDKFNFQSETKIKRYDGTTLYARVQAELISNKKGKLIRAVGVIQDITNHKNLEEELYVSEGRFKNIADNLQAGIWSLDIKESHYWTSKGIEKITGYTPQDFHNQLTWDAIVHPEDKENYDIHQKKLHLGERLFHQYRIVHKNGKSVWIQDQTIPIYDENKNLIRLEGIVTDITYQKAYEKQITHLAFHDYLTGLPNRTYFDQKINSFVQKDKQGKQPFSMMYLDLDRFRNINNSIGQLIGDQLLRKISRRMEKLLNDSSLLAKIDGDEFGILLWDYEEANYPITIAKSIIISLSKPFFVEDYELYITVSIGISTYPDNGLTPGDLMKNADIALYRAKNNGKNTFQIYSPSLNIDTFKQYHLESDLRKSIDNNQLKIYYQPRVEAATGKIISAEALIRWEHPVWGLVSPAEFIPLSEETGFVNDITDWVLRQTCLSLKEWERLDLSIIPISINVSAQRFMKNDWKETITAILEETNTDPKLIEFEITETILIEHEKSVGTALDFLRELGIKIALDDFGTGYSSMAYVHKFPIDTIKIDRSFIKEISKSESMEVIIKSIIYMAKGLNLNIVAEGVETINQLAFLKQLECQEIQGYLFSKPVPIDQFQALLKRDIISIAMDGKQEITENRRKHFRVSLTFPLRGQLTLVSLQGEEVEVGTDEVLIEDIGPGGLRFLSNIKLPVRPDIIYQFQTTILDENIEVTGKIVWKKEVKSEFEYGLEFKMHTVERDHLILILNELSLKLRHNLFVPDSDIVTEDRFTYLNKQKAKKQKTTTTSLLEG